MIAPFVTWTDEDGQVEIAVIDGHPKNNVWIHNGERIDNHELTRRIGDGKPTRLVPFSEDANRKEDQERISALERMVAERNEIIAAIRAVRLKSYNSGWDGVDAAYSMKYRLGRALGLENEEELRESPGTVRYPDLDIEFNRL